MFALKRAAHQHAFKSKQDGWWIYRPIFRFSKTQRIKPNVADKRCSRTTLDIGSAWQLTTESCDETTNISEYIHAKIIVTEQASLTPRAESRGNKHRRQVLRKQTITNSKNTFILPTDTTKKHAFYTVHVVNEHLLIGEQQQERCQTPYYLTCEIKHAFQRRTRRSKQPQSGHYQH